MALLDHIALFHFCGLGALFHFVDSAACLKFVDSLVRAVFHFCRLSVLFIFVDLTLFHFCRLDALFLIFADLAHCFIFVNSVFRIIYVDLAVYFATFILFHRFQFCSSLPSIDVDGIYSMQYF